MGLITGVTLPNNGDRIKVENYNDPISRILAEVNGNLDGSNILSVPGTKITAGTIPQTALDSSTTAGWRDALSTPTSITHTGNGSYDMLFAADQTSVYQPGMRMRTTISGTGVSQSTKLNGTTQFWQKTSPNNVSTITNTFSVTADVMLDAYTGAAIVSNDSAAGTGSGFEFGTVLNTGQLQVFARNGTGNIVATSADSLEIGRKYHVAATFQASTGAIVLYINGYPTAAGITTNGTTIVPSNQPLTIGKRNSSANYLAGTLQNVALFNSVLSAATIKQIYQNGLTGAESGLVSAWSFNGNANDLNGGSNSLTASGTATATNPDSFRGVRADGVVSTTQDYVRVSRVSGTTVTVQAPEGCRVPTTIASLAYATTGAPYGFPLARSRWQLVLMLNTAAQLFVNPAVNVWQNPGGQNLWAPAGDWRVVLDAQTNLSNSSTAVDGYFTVSTLNNARGPLSLTGRIYLSAANLTKLDLIHRDMDQTFAAPTQLFINVLTTNSGTTIGFRGDGATGEATRLVLEPSTI